MCAQTDLVLSLPHAVSARVGVSACYGLAREARPNVTLLESHKASAGGMRLSNTHLFASASSALRTQLQPYPLVSYSIVEMALLAPPQVCLPCRLSSG